MNYIHDYSEKVDIVRMIVDQNYSVLGEKFKPMIMEKLKGKRDAVKIFDEEVLNE